MCANFHFEALVFKLEADNPRDAIFGPLMQSLSRLFRFAPHAPPPLPLAPALNILSHSPFSLPQK